MTTPTDTAALAANDKTLAEHVADAQAQANPPAAPESSAPVTDPPPEIPSSREAALERELTALKQRLQAFEERRKEEQQLLADRDSALMSIESAKNRVAAEKKELSEIEAEIAALLKQPLPVAFEETPIGKVIADANAPALPKEPELAGWSAILPLVGEESVRLVGEVYGELPSDVALRGALMRPEILSGEKRSIPLNLIVTCYGRPYIVSHLWVAADEKTCRANCLPLYSKDEWQQTHEAKFGRCVADFDQSEEAKNQRQLGGDWCGLVVKISRKVYVVGPQADALHLAYDAPEAPESHDDGITPEAHDEPEDDDQEDGDQFTGPGVPAAVA